MDARSALHTAARHYCIDRSGEWRQRYANQLRERGDDRRSFASLPEDYATFPRYLVLDAILDQVERVLPSDFDGLEMLREFLMLAGEASEDGFTRNLDGNAIAVQAMTAERVNYCSYIRDLEVSGLEGVIPLPFRHRLSAVESAHIWDALDQHWGTHDGKYWYPLTADNPSGVVAVQADWFHLAITEHYLIGLLRSRGISRFWDLYEGGLVHELDVELFYPHYGHFEGHECYSTAGEMDWLIYASHESSITIAGDWLIEAVKAKWPEWGQHLYTGWNYERPPKI